VREPGLFIGEVTLEGVGYVRNYFSYTGIINFDKGAAIEHSSHVVSNEVEHNLYRKCRK